jgi:hypothetical protein
LTLILKVLQSLLAAVVVRHDEAVPRQYSKLAGYWIKANSGSISAADTLKNRCSEWRGEELISLFFVFELIRPSMFEPMLVEVIEAFADPKALRRQRHQSILGQPPIGIGAAANRFGLGTAIAVDALFFALGAVLIWMLPETKGAEV